MWQYRIRIIPLKMTPTVNQTVTVWFRLSNLPDTPSSYSLLAQNVVVLQTGELVTPLVIDNIPDGIGIVIRIKNDCGGNDLYVPVSPEEPGTTIPGPTTVPTSILPCPDVTDIIGFSYPGKPCVDIIGATIKIGPMGFRVITQFQLQGITTAQFIASVFVRKASDPDVQGSYSLVSNNVVVQPSGALFEALAITGLLDNTGYVVKGYNNCGGNGFTDYFETGPVPTTIAPTTQTPTTQPITTQGPATTQAPTTIAPTTAPPTTIPATTVPITTGPPTLPPPTTAPPKNYRLDICGNWNGGTAGTAQVFLYDQSLPGGEAVCPDDDIQVQFRVTDSFGLQNTHSLTVYKLFCIGQGIFTVFAPITNMEILSISPTSNNNQPRINYIIGNYTGVC